MFCKKCGSPIKDGARFCPKCGVEIITRPENHSYSNDYIPDNTVSGVDKAPKKKKGVKIAAISVALLL
ncbi:MAG: zinc ribbon domain-containing protein [Ruminococcus sp.]|nr:zinc ribbon domain-containing protein [Ruminococcus sp.]